MKIAYITTCFGSQSHTFIRREITALRKAGLAIRLYGIRKDPQPASDASAMVAETWYLYPLKPVRTVLANFHYLFHTPLHYGKGLSRAFTSEEFSLGRRLKMVYHYFISAPVARVIEHDQITHIHAHFMNVSASIAMYAAHHCQLPFSVTVHSAGEYRTPHVLGIKQKLKEAQFLAMISDFNIRYFDPIEACRDKSHVIRCGMDMENFDFRPPRSLHHPPHHPLKILAVGRFVQKKGFEYLVEAIGVLHREHFPVRAKFVGDGPLLESCQKQAIDNGLTELIDFAGRQGTDYVQQALLEADVLVVPSVTSDTGEMEGLPVVIMEAMACGVFVIASDHSGISELVKNGETGLLTREKNAIDIADALRSVTTLNTETLINNAHHYLNEHFNISVVAAKRLALFTRYHQETNNSGSDQQDQ